MAYERSPAHVYPSVFDVLKASVLSKRRPSRMSHCPRALKLNDRLSFRLPELAISFNTLYLYPNVR